MNDTKKAILVLEMPEICDMCYLCRIRRDGRYCVVAKQCNTRVGCVPDYCPLRPLPEKLDTTEIAMQCGMHEVSDKLVYQVEGFNRCIDLILEENKK